VQNLDSVALHSILNRNGSAMSRCRTYICLTTTQTKEKMALAKMSTLSDQIAAQAAAEVKPKRKRKTAKRDEHGRFVKKAEDTADLDTPSF